MSLNFKIKKGKKETAPMRVKHGVCNLEYNSSTNCKTLWCLINEGKNKTFFCHPRIQKGWGISDRYM